MKYLYLLGMVLISFEQVKSQAASYSDPGQAYLRLMIEKSGEGTYQRINNYKVLGTPLLFGGNYIGDMYYKNNSAKNVILSYDTYKQRVIMNVGEEGKDMSSQLSEVDSFVLKSTGRTEFPGELLFVNSIHLDSSKSFFAQHVFTGPKFTLFKAYKSDLAIVSTNYIQSELRQFELNYDFYYKENGKPGLKKLKNNQNGIQKEFKSISNGVELTAYELNPELSLIRLFSSLK